MQNELRRFPETETGGLLLGHRTSSCEISVVAATDGGYQNAIHDSHYFCYDVAYVHHVCNIISQLYDPPLELIGVWHKHNQQTNPTFSYADEEMHHRLMEHTDYPCLSILFERHREQVYDFRVFMLSKLEQHKDVTQQTILPMTINCYSSPSQ